MDNRGHAASITTLALEAQYKHAPEVSFIHNFPGVVKSGITRGTTGILMGTMKAVFAFLRPLVYMAPEECGDRHVFLCTSARYSTGAQDIASGVSISDKEGLTLARGTDGKTGSGVYSIDTNGESAKPEVERLLAGLRSHGMVEIVWNTIQSDTEGALTLQKTT